MEGIEYATRRETRMTVDASRLTQTVYDGVEETEFEVNGCELTVEDFHMTHLGASFRLRVTAPKEMDKAEGMAYDAIVCEIASEQREDSDADDS